MKKQPVKLIKLGNNNSWGLDDFAQVASNTYLEKKRMDFEASLTPEERMIRYNDRKKILYVGVSVVAAVLGVLWLTHSGGSAKKNDVVARLKTYVDGEYHAQKVNAMSSSEIELLWQYFTKYSWVAMDDLFVQNKVLAEQIRQVTNKYGLGLILKL